jgi:hypothetical protein
MLKLVGILVIGVVLIGIANSDLAPTKTAADTADWCRRNDPNLTATSCVQFKKNGVPVPHVVTHQEQVRQWREEATREYTVHQIQDILFAAQRVVTYDNVCQAVKSDRLESSRVMLDAFPENASVQAADIQVAIDRLGKRWFCETVGVALKKENAL